MSSDSTVRICAAKSPRFPPQCKSSEGKSALRVCLSQRGCNPMDKQLIFCYRVYICKGVTKVEESCVLYGASKQ
jgi:hypothetical protein